MLALSASLSSIPLSGCDSPEAACQQTAGKSNSRWKLGFYSAEHKKVISAFLVRITYRGIFSV